ncbi:hypothetical protein [Ekhidna sp.]
MIKFVSVLASVVSINFLVAFTTTTSPEVELEFSNQAIAIESGQPVFSKDTKVWVSNPRKEELKLYINEVEKEISEGKVDLADITNLNEGTYTLIVNSKTEEKVFGFTIQ